MKDVSPEFLTAFNQDVMKLSHKMIVEFGSNRFNDGLTVTASSTKLPKTGITNLSKEDIEFWKAEDVFNNINYNTMNWLVCDVGAEIDDVETGGGYRCMALEEGAYERGWWSEETSDDGGVFTNDLGSLGTGESVDATFDERRVNKIVLYLTEGYENMKVVSVMYMNQDDEWVYLEENYELEEDEYEVVWDIEPDDLIIKGLRVIVHESYRPDDFARVSELNAYWIEDISEYVMTADSRESREEYESAVPIGSVSANSLDVELDNVEGHFNVNNNNSPYSKYIGPNCRVEFYLGIDKGYATGDPEDIEYVQMGEYWTNEWDVGGDSVTCRVTCVDRSKFLMEENTLTNKVWTNTTAPVVFNELMLLAGIHKSKIGVAHTTDRGYQIVYVKDQPTWQFLSEIALADQGIFGFDHEGNAIYQSYDVIEGNPSQVDLSWETNIEDMNVRSAIWLNSVKVEISEINTEETGTARIWSPESPCILSYSRLGADISDSATTIPIVAAPGQSTGNLTSNTWTDLNGILWLPKLNGNQDIIGGELIKYKNRTDSEFQNCERGYLNTVAQSHTSGAYIGEARFWSAEWDNSPALTVKYPFVTAIDELGRDTDDRGDIAQARIILFDYDSFGGKLCIANIVNDNTILEGTGTSLVDRGNEADGVNINFSTSVSGMVAKEKSGSQRVEVENEIPTEENLDLIRRYGKNEIEINSKWIQTRKHAEDYAQTMIEEWETPRFIYDLNHILSPAYQAGDKVTVVNYPQLDVENIEFHIMSLEFSYDGGLSGTAQLRQVKS